MAGEMILIAGGYGVVGSRIARVLAPLYPGRVVVAGRSQQRADAAAGAVGHGARGRAFDVTQPPAAEAALGDAVVVVSCVDQPQRLLLHAALRRGLAYTDITPHLTEVGRGEAYEQIDAAAKASGARVILGAGLVPGISNVMVRAIAGTIGGVDQIETALLLAAGDLSGPASFGYFLQELAMPFTVHADGADRRARAFTHPRRVEFPGPAGRRTAYLFPFSDQVLYPRTLGARTVITRLALDPPWLARLLALAVHSGAARLAARPGIRGRLARRRGQHAAGGDARFALRVDVTGNGQAGHATLAGGAQADGAAIATASLARSLVDGEVTQAGAWMPEQVIDPPRFFTRLAEHGLQVTVTATP